MSEQRHNEAVFHDAAAESFRQDAAGAFTYLGSAAPGTTTSEAKWQISRLTVADNTILYAEGDPGYNFVWDDRASLSYS